MDSKYYILIALAVIALGFVFRGISCYLRYGVDKKYFIEEFSGDMNYYAMSICVCVAIALPIIFNIPLFDDSQSNNPNHKVVSSGLK